MHEKNLIEEFNTYYERATRNMKGTIILGKKKLQQITFIEKVRIKKAIKNFEKCLELNPNHWQSLFFLGKLFQRLNDHQRSLDYFTSALEIELLNYDIPQEASIEAALLGKFDEAIKYSREAIRRNPSDYALMGNHALHLFNGGYRDDAMKMIVAAILVNPNDVLNLRIKTKIEFNILE